MIPTRRLAALLALALLPAALAIAWTEARWIVAAWDLALAAAFLVDFWRCPNPGSVLARREVEEILSAGAANPVRLHLENPNAAPCRGQIADAPPPACTTSSHRRSFELGAGAQLTLSYLLTPQERGDHAFGDLHLRLSGPWGLAQRQCRTPATRVIKAYPALAALERDALALARPEIETGLARMRRSLGEGREFESLRDYVCGDDMRLLDWKATAKRQRPITRHFEPERNQPVLLMIDCGRHMVGRLSGRGKLDWAIDAALRLARISLEKGDLVGLCAFGARTLAYLPPRRGRAQLRALADALYPLQPRLCESDYDLAFDLVAARQRRRALLAVFTDVLDADSSRSLLARTALLRPRHLPLIVAMADPALSDPARAVPATAEDAYLRAAARTIVRERERALGLLREAGASVLSVAAPQLSAASINAYLDVKAAGRL